MLALVPPNFLLLVDISLGLITLLVYVTVSTRAAPTRLILGSDWLTAIYNSLFCMNIKANSDDRSDSTC